MSLIRKAKDAAKEARATWRRARVARQFPTRDVSHEPAVVIAPHPDDETFGIGATLAQYALRGIKVHCVCSTRGEAGTVDPELMKGLGSGIKEFKEASKEDDKSSDKKE